jgi:hypothetical protein
MNGWWSDDVTAVAAKIDPLGEPRTITRETSGVSKIEVASAAPGDRLHSGRVRPEPPLQPLERGVTAVFRIDVEYNQIRDLARDDADIGIGPASEPIGDVIFRRSFMLQILPRDERSLVARAQRQN